MDVVLCNDCKPQEYTRAKDIPFRPLGNDPVIGLGSFGVVEKVVGTVASEKAKEAVRKTITITAAGPDKDEVIRAARARVAEKMRIIHQIRDGHAMPILATYFFNKSDTEIRFAVIMDAADKNRHSCIVQGGVRKEWFGCLISVVMHIHELGIRHGDIKPTNILIKGDRVFLTDFGLSKLDLGETLPTLAPKWVYQNTAAHCAPEVEKRISCGRSADIFSLGTVFLEMLFDKFHSNKDVAGLGKILRCTGAKSYARNIELVHKWMDDTKTKLQLEHWKMSMFSLCRKMLAASRAQRPRAEELAAAWFNMVCPEEQCGTCAGHVFETEDDRLVKACKKGSVEEVLRLLDGGADANSVGGIQQAASAGHVNVVRALLGRNANVNGRDFGGQTALHCAAGSGNKDVVQLLLDEKVDIEARDEKGRYAILLAAGRGHAAVVRLLLCDIRAVAWRDLEMRTALHCASGNGHAKVVQLLLEADADIEAKDGEGRDALHYAAGSGHEKTVRLLLALNANIEATDEEGRSALHYAAGSGHANLVRLLLDSGADVEAMDGEGRRALHFATEKGHHTAVQAILGHNAKTEAESDQVRLGSQNINCMNSVQTPAVVAKAQQPANINVSDKYGQTALHFAANNGHMGVFRTLLDSGADITVLGSQVSPRWNSMPVTVNWK